MAADDVDSETVPHPNPGDRVPMDIDFDVHAVRHRLKQLRDSGETALYANRGDVECPGCGEAFSRLFVTRNSVTTFPENDGSRFCLVRSAGIAYIFRH